MSIKAGTLEAELGSFESQLPSTSRVGVSELRGFLNHHGRDTLAVDNEGGDSDDDDDCVGDDFCSVRPASALTTLHVKRYLTSHLVRKVDVAQTADIDVYVGVLEGVCQHLHKSGHWPEETLDQARALCAAGRVHIARGALASTLLRAAVATNAATEGEDGELLEGCFEVASADGEAGGAGGLHLISVVPDHSSANSFKLPGDRAAHSTYQVLVTAEVAEQLWLHDCLELSCRRVRDASSDAGDRWLPIAGGRVFPDGGSQRTPRPTPAMPPPRASAGGTAPVDEQLGEGWDNDRVPVGHQDEDEDD